LDASSRRESINDRLTATFLMQHRSLVRCSNLAGFRQSLVELTLSGEPLEARRRVVIVPTRASAELLRQTIESAAVSASRRAIVLPDLLTRDEWMSRLHVALPGATPLLGRVERELLLAAAARAAAARTRMSAAPFQLRPGLVAAMLDLYDELHRRQRTVRRFARSLFDQLRVERGTDRGSESLIHQTCFLGFTFLGYERRVAASGSMDEHVLRRLLIDRQPDLPFSHVVIAVADRPTDPRGLWPADFDLVGRLRGVARIDVVVTDEAHDAGLRERVESELPGVVEARRDVVRDPPVVLTPGGAAGESCFVSRDREEELRDVARAIRGRAGAAASTLLETTAIVFHRPLPYLYLAQHVLADAGVPYQALDALPLASEPYAALLDLVLAVARTGGTREAMTALLRSRLMEFRESVGDVAVAGRDVAALDFALAERRSIGEADTYVAEIDGLIAQRRGRPGIDPDQALRAARIAARIRAELLAFRSGETAADQVKSISGFLRRYERAIETDDPADDRQVRARTAVLASLDDLVRAFRLHDDRRLAHDDLTSLIHHQIEGRTFAPRRGRRGVQLVDAAAARFGRFDHVHLVGLVETDWPERPSRSIFYTSGLLKALGWPQEPDHARAQQAAFRDLLGLPARTATLHAFQLDGDAIVARSPLIDHAGPGPQSTTAGTGLKGRPLSPAERASVFPSVPPPAVFSDEVLTRDDAPLADLPDTTRRWLELRRRRPAIDDRRYRGFVAPPAHRPYRISRVDRYVDCPFKFFSEDVLGLPEEREEMSGLTPLERGTLVHELFERFYRAWQAQGEGTITPSTLPKAVALFGRLTRDALERLPEADRALEESRLLGSIVARGLAERVFELESDAGGRVVDRLLEFDLRGPFTFPQLLGLKEKTIDVRGKADRVDVFHDGSLRVIDYKLGRLPDVSTSVQIGVYAHCARAVLTSRDGRPHPVKSAMYLAFGDDKKLEGPLGSSSQPADMAVDARASDFASIIDRIEAGEFPPKPLRPGECQWCPYALVCRKEYAPDSDEAAELV
jgi:RecB family exonuclease